MSGLFSGNSDVNDVIKDYLDRKLASYNDLQYAYMVLNKKNPTEVLIISNYPSQWVKIYKENNYQNIDSVVFSALHRVSPFSWDECLSITPPTDSSKIFTLAKSYNIINGYTFVLHDNNNNLAMLSFMTSNRKNMDIEDKIENKKDKLQMLLVTAHERITTLYKEMVQHKSAKSNDEKFFLSTRENEILYWASMGKTYQEIALILGVKISTVKFHIGNVVKKLGVSNAKHAIRLGAELQLVKPVSD